MMNKYKLVNKEYFCDNLSKIKVLEKVLIVLSSDGYEIEHLLSNTFFDDMPFSSNEYIEDDYIELNIQAKKFSVLNIYKYDYIDDLIDFLKITYEIIINIDSDSTIKFNDMIKHTPLNQIYYGPPGSGKTFSLIQDSISILGENNQITLCDKFNLLYSQDNNFLTSRKYKPGQKPYRNMLPILDFLKYFDEKSLITETKENIISHFGWDGPSTYIQRARILLNFNLVSEEWDSSGDTLTLNEDGRQLVSTIQAYKSLKGEYPTELTNEIKEYFLSSLKSTTIDNMTLWKNMIFCALRWLICENTIIKCDKKYNSNIEDKLIKYFNNPTLEISYPVTYLENLGLVEELKPKTIAYGKEYILSDLGKEFITDIKLFNDLNYNSNELVQLMFKKYQKIGFLEFVTFHQSTSYEEFIEGIKPKVLETQEKKEIIYEIEDGIFKSICDRAKKIPDQNFVLIIDEINRGNISNIFGELITLIEEPKRYSNKESLEIKLLYSKKLFSIPKNLYILGSMNTVDRSIGLIDNALRRRFSFKEIPSDSSLLSTSIEDGINLKLLFETINKRISFLIDKEHALGHSEFMNISTIKDLNICLRDKVIPQLQEYFYNEWDKIQLVLGDNDNWGKNFDDKLIQENNEITLDNLFNESDIEGFEETILYQVNCKLNSVGMNSSALKKIYEQ